MNWWSLLLISLWVLKDQLVYISWLFQCRITCFFKTLLVFNLAPYELLNSTLYHMFPSYWCFIFTVKMLSTTVRTRIDREWEKRCFESIWNVWFEGREKMCYWFVELVAGDIYGRLSYCHSSSDVFRHIQYIYFF